MHVALFVECSNPQHDLSAIKSNKLFGETFDFAVDLVKFSSINERHNEVEPQITLENKIHISKERMLRFQHDGPLQERTFNLIGIKEYIFSDCFNCIQFAYILQFSQVDSTECTLSECTFNLKALQRQISRLIRSHEFRRFLEIL